MSYTSKQMTVYLMKRYFVRKQKLIDLLGGKCNKCGSVNILEFDHVDKTTKSFVITTSLGSRKWETVLNELKKCQLLCAICHQEKSLVDNGQKSTLTNHGISRYSSKKCRCEICKTEWNNLHKKYKRENRVTR